MHLESLPADARRKKKTCMTTAVDRNTASNSLLAARQLYGRDAATTSLRSDVFSAGSAAALNGNQSHRSTGLESPPFRDQQGGKDQLGVTKRRKRPRSKGVDADVRASSGRSNQVASKESPRLTALQLADGKVRRGHAGDSNVHWPEKTITPHAGVSAALALTPEEAGNCVAFVDTARAVPKCGRRQEARDRKKKQATGLKPVRSVHAANKRPVKQVPGSLKGVSSLSQRELSRQMRLLTPGEQGVINRVLKAFVAHIDGKSMRTRDFFDLMDSNRDNVLTRAEMEQALVDRKIVLRDEQLTHLMAFFDVQGRGYVTLGDLHESLRTFRAVHARGPNATTPAYPQKSSRPHPRPPTDSTAATRLQTALLAPLVLFSTPTTIEESERRHRSTTKAREKRMLEQETGTSYLDMTDSEIGSLADWLIEAGKGDGSKENLGCGKGDFSSSAIPSKLRPLSLVMAALESAASRAPRSSNLSGGQTESVRGPGEAAIPSSAARVLRILRSLQKLWRHKDRRRREKALMHRASDEFSDEKLGAAVGLFDLDPKGEIDLEDVLTVFRNVRVGKCIRRRPPTAAVPSLVALGRYLDNRGITAHDFVQEAAAVSVAAIADPLQSCGQPRDGKTPASTRRSTATRNKVRPATTAQLAALLSVEVSLSAEQRAIVLACIEDCGVVSGADLAGAVRRARAELAHRKLDRMERQRGTVGIGSGGCGSSDTGSHLSGFPLAESGCAINSPPRGRQQAGGVTAQKAGATMPPQHKHRCGRSKPSTEDVFNRSDASQVLELFMKECGGLRGITGETAVAVWRGLKRRSRGLHAYEAGRLASRHLRQLLRARGMKPMQWFASLCSVAGDTSEGGDGGSGTPRAVMASVIDGADALAESAERSTLEVLDTATSTAAGDDSSATASLEGSLSNSDCSLEETSDDVGRDMNWTREQLAALSRHLDPCRQGNITQTAFQEGLCDRRVGPAAYPDAVRLAAARRFEAALREVGCRDVCGLFQTLAGGGRGGGDLVEYIREMGECVRSTSRELDAAARQGRVARAIAIRESEVIRSKERKSALLEKVMRPENAGALSTIEKIDELMAMQGRRLVVEFNQADVNYSGGVDRAELKQALENLVRPCSLLRFERKQRRERQEAAAAAAQRAECWKESFMQKMEALDQSKASKFLEVVSEELRQRRWQIRDIFRDVDRAKSGAISVDDLLENTHRALGLTLKRGEAAALISMLDANGDNCIQCEELELALRMYRRYGWERDRWTRRKPFHEEYPSLSCLFRRGPRGAGAGAGAEDGVDPQQRQQQQGQQGQEHLPARHRSIKVNREDVVAALLRLRGDLGTSTAAGKRGRGDLLPAHGANVRRRRVLRRAVRKVARCCQAAGVRTAPALAATLAFFDFGPADETRRKAGRMRAVDLWHWLRLLSVPAESGGGRGAGSGGVGSSLGSSHHGDVHEGQRRAKGIIGRHRRYNGDNNGNNNNNNNNNHRPDSFGSRGRAGCQGGDGMVSGRLLDSEETSVLLDAVECRAAVGAVGEVAKSAPTRAAPGADFVSVSAFWNLLLEHVPELWDRELQARLEAAEAERKEEEWRNRRSAAALTIQSAARQRQARKAARAALIIQEEKGVAARTVQLAVRRRQLRQQQANLAEIKSNEAAARIQAMERGRVARHHAAAERAARAAAAAKAEAEAQAKAELEESARRLAAAIEERDAARATVKIQCAARQRHARKKVARQFRRQQQEEEERVVAARSVEAVTQIQSFARGRLVRMAGEKAANVAAMDAAIAARQARVAAAAEGAGTAGGGVDQGRTGWRKKSVVGARGAEGMAGLQVQLPPTTVDT